MGNGKPYNIFDMAQRQFDRCADLLAGAQDLLVPSPVLVEVDYWLMQLGGAKVCLQIGTTTELNLADFFRSNKMKYEVIAFTFADEALKAYESGRCNVLTSDSS